MTDDTDSGNIIPFPVTKKNVPVPVKSQDEILLELMGAIRQTRHEEFHHNLIELIMIELDTYGIDVEKVTTDQIKDVGLIVEAAKSLICRYYGNEHSLQHIADDYFKPSEDGVGIRVDDKAEFMKYTKPE